MLYVFLSFFFILGYIAIIFENFLHVNKAAIALVMAVICWLIYFTNTTGPDFSSQEMADQISGVAQIIFFLLAAMVIVELIDSHGGFKIITDWLQTSSKVKLFWLLVVISFFMSSILDNLTSMIVMVSLLRKLLPDQEDRWIIGSILVISVNAGGAWTPIGDVTTTMLWIDNKISTWEIMKSIFFPSVVCIGVSGLLAMLIMKKDAKNEIITVPHPPMAPGAKRILFLGVAALIMIPVWKAAFNLPPFMGALIGLGVLWLVTDIFHHRYGQERWHLRVPHILSKIDTSGILFFLGILLAIDSLAMSGILQDAARFLENVLPNQNYVAVLIGLLSSVVDNVPLVAATMGMYDMQTFPMDSPLWKLIAYAAGTGGSILIIGSAAGVAFMGLEKVDFIWYLKKISWIALIGYFAGIIAYFLQLHLVAA